MFGSKQRKRIIYDRVGYLLISPFYLFFLLFIFIPIMINLLLSFTQFNLRSIAFIGIQNYINLFTDSFFLISLRNTAVYTFFTLVFTMVLSLLAAVFLNQRIFGKSLFRTCFFLPYVTSMVAVSMVWFWMYEPSHGVINKVLGLFGIQGKLWLYDVNWALPAIIIMSVWKYIGYYMVIYLAALQGNIEAVKQHIGAGSNLNERDAYGSTPLIVAATFGKTDVAKALIEAGADLDARNNDGATALHAAALLCRTEIVGALLDKGANKDLTDNLGNTPLESVADPFDDVKGIYDGIAQALGPLGLVLDYDFIRVTRPRIAEMLRPGPGG